MEVSCYHFVWVVMLQVLSAPFTLGFVTIVRHTCFQIFNWVCRMWNSFCLDFKVSIATSLKNPSRLSRDVLTKWCPRTIYLVPSLPQEMEMRSLGKTHTSSWDTICSDNLFVMRIVVYIFNSCGRSGPKKEGWWHRFWMCLNPILMIYSSLLRLRVVA